MGRRLVILILLLCGVVGLAAQDAKVIITAPTDVLPPVDVGVTAAGELKVNAVFAAGVVVSTKTALTFNAPIAATVGVASAQALAANASRKGLIAVNTSSNTISCTVAQTAVLNSGITLQPGAVWNMNEYSFATGAVNCIASGAGSNLSLQETQ